MKQEAQSNLSDYLKSFNKVSRSAALALTIAVTAPGITNAANSTENNTPDTEETIQVPIEVFTSQDNPLSTGTEIELFNGQVIIFPEVSKPDGINIPPNVAIEVPSPPEFDPESQIYKKNLFFRKGYNPQDNLRTCGASGVQMMLNFIAKNGTPGEEFVYKINTSHKHEQKLFRYTRNHDKLYAGGVGTDPLGIVEALNWFGYHVRADSEDAVYEIKAYKNRKNALKHAVRAMARHDKPVGVLGWGGTHFQVFSGYKSEGLDPAFSNKFEPKGFNLSSPLITDNQVNKYIPYDDFFNGDWNEVFRRYNQGDSPKDNPLTKRRRPASDDWDGRYIIIVPVK